MLRSLTATLGLATSSLCLLAVNLRAGELDASTIPAGARWLAHIDVERFAHSRLMESVEKQIRNELDRNQMPDEMREAWDKLGFDPLKDLYSVTVFSAADTPERTVAMIETSSSLDRVLEQSGQWLDRDTVEEDGMSVQCWKEKDSSHPLQFSSVLRKGDDRRVLVASSRADDLVAALRVCRGKAKSLRDADQASIPRSTRPGCFFFAAASAGLIEGLADLPYSQVARLARSMRLEAGEHDGNVFVSLAAQTSDEPQARKVMQILQGASALLSLASAGADSEDLDQFQRLFQCLRFECNGARIQVTFEENVERVIELIDARHGRREADAKESGDAKDSKGTRKIY